MTMRASTETAKLNRVDVTAAGKVIKAEYGHWVDAQEAMLLVEQLQDLCRKYKGIAGACLSGTDEIERIAAESAHHFEAFDKAMAIHRKRDDDLIASLRKLWGPE